MIRKALALFALGLLARGEEIAFDLNAGERKLVSLDSPVDDSHLRDPMGYTGPGTRARLFTRKIELSNTGDKPLAGRLLVVNGRAIWNAETMRNFFGPGDGRVAVERLFSFWRDHRAHAGSGMALAAEPFAALNFWGFTLCGEDTLSLAKMARVYGIETRYVQLNGHIAAEYFFDKTWHVVDGDQNAFYLKLDNKTLASAEDLRADPFLVLRTKVFGKLGLMTPASSAFNSGLLEHVNVDEPKPIALKTGPAPLNIFTLQPGEKIIWHCDMVPDHVVGIINSEKPDRLKEAVLATIEHRLNVAKAQRSDKGMVTVRAPYPITKVVNETTGQTVVPKDIAFKTEIATKSVDDKVAVYMQCSQFALPIFSKGSNSVELAATGGSAHVSYEYDPDREAVVPDLRVTGTAKDGKFPGPATFNIETKPVADRLWWQVSTDRAFTFIPPNFDTVSPFVPLLRFDPLTDTFFSPGQTYYLRVKAHANGVWGEWSPPLSFRVTKPAQPLAGRFAGIGGAQVRLSWTGTAEEYDVFASNRADFLPEALGKDEIVSMEGTMVKQVNPNKNLVATVKLPQYEFTPEYRYYRIIAKKGGVRSIPSPLFVLPDEFAASLPVPTILQVRVTTEGKKEIYAAHEEKMVPPAKKEPGPDAGKPDDKAAPPDAKKSDDKKSDDKSAAKDTAKKSQDAAADKAAPKSDAKKPAGDKPAKEK